MLPAKGYSNNSSGKLPDLYYSHPVNALWGARVGYVIGVLALLVCAYAAAQIARDQQYALLFRIALSMGIVVTAMITGRDVVYKIEASGDSIALQTAFSRKEYRLSELKDVYRMGNLRGGLFWIIETADCKYKFEAKNENARKTVTALLQRTPSPVSFRWTEFNISDSDEKSYLLIAISVVLVGIATAIFGHAGIVVVVLLVCCISMFIVMNRVVRNVKVNQGGITIVNILRQETMVPWASITSVKQAKGGQIFLNSSQGKFILHGLDGSNILLQKAAQNVAPKFFIDQVNPVPKLNQNKN